MNWLCVLTYNIEETTYIPHIDNCMVMFLVNSLVLQITYIESDRFSSSSSISNSNNTNLSDTWHRSKESTITSEKQSSGFYNQADEVIPKSTFLLEYPFHCTLTDTVPIKEGRLDSQSVKIQKRQLLVVSYLLLQQLSIYSHYPGLTVSSSKKTALSAAPETVRQHDSSQSPDSVRTRPLLSKPSSQ